MDLMDARTLQRSACRGGFVAALVSGGDSRLAVDPRTGVNKYLCPPVPASDLVCVSSCTASPVALDGFERATECYSHLEDAPSPRQRAQRLEAAAADVQARLLRRWAADGLAEAVLCPSGTDALLLAALLLAAERPRQAMTAILPIASETGAGVPLAAACRRFEAGPGCGDRLAETVVDTVEIPLRAADGAPLPPATVDTAAWPRAVVYLTHGTKTGLVAPLPPPCHADVIVDACQARIDPAAVAAYLRRGWPVVVTGSKFFGGPPFSGAVLFPHARLAAAHQPVLRAHGVPAEGVVLRWVAALAAMEAFAPVAGGMAALLRRWAGEIEHGLAALPGLVPVGGLAAHGPSLIGNWTAMPSIFAFAVRDPADRRRLLSAAALRPLYERLARGGVLLGQPVTVGGFGALRIAAGARDLLEPGAGTLPQVFAALGSLAP